MGIILATLLRFANVTCRIILAVATRRAVESKADESNAKIQTEPTHGRR